MSAVYCRSAFAAAPTGLSTSFVVAGKKSTPAFDLSLQDSGTGVDGMMRALKQFGKKLETCKNLAVLVGL